MIAGYFPAIINSIPYFYEYFKGKREVFSTFYYYSMPGADLSTFLIFLFDKELHDELRGKHSAAGGKRHYQQSSVEQSAMSAAANPTHAVNTDPVLKNIPGIVMAVSTA